MARVIEFLADRGKDDVELKKRRGNKFIIIDPETPIDITVVMTGGKAIPRHERDILIAKVRSVRRTLICEQLPITNSLDILLS